MSPSRCRQCPTSTTGPTSIRWDAYVRKPRGPPTIPAPERGRGAPDAPERAGAGCADTKAGCPEALAAAITKAMLKDRERAVADGGGNGGGAGAKRRADEQVRAVSRRGGRRSPGA